MDDEALKLELKGILAKHPDLATYFQAAEATYRFFILARRLVEDRLQESDVAVDIKDKSPEHAANLAELLTHSAVALVQNSDAHAPHVTLGKMQDDILPFMIEKVRERNRAADQVNNEIAAAREEERRKAPVDAGFVNLYRDMPTLFRGMPDILRSMLRKTLDECTRYQEDGRPIPAVAYLAAKGESPVTQDKACRAVFKPGSWEDLHDRPKRLKELWTKATGFLGRPLDLVIVGDVQLCGDVPQVLRRLSRWAKEHGFALLVGMPNDKELPPTVEKRIRELDDRYDLVPLVPGTSTGSTIPVQLGFSGVSVDIPVLSGPAPSDNKIIV